MSKYKIYKNKKSGVTPQGVPTTDKSVGQSPSKKIKSKKVICKDNLFASNSV